MRHPSPLRSGFPRAPLALFTARTRNRWMLALVRATVLGSGPYLASAPASAQSEPETVAESRLASTGRYRAEGRVLLQRLGDGSFRLRLEDINVDPGPDLRVHLVPGRDARHPDGGVELGRLTAVTGTHDYPVPRGTAIDLRRGVTALIYCHQFSVPFGNATLTTG